MTGAHPALSIVGGSVLAEDGSLRAGPVHVAEGRIRSEAGAAAVEIDLSRLPDAVVVPGLVDVHVHAFRGQDAGIDADEVGARTGVTTMLDAGSAGAHLLDAFAATSVKTAATRMRAMVNVATIGITSFVLRGELHEPAYLDRDALLAAIDQHHGLVHGIKVRASTNVGGENTTAAFQFARSVADETGLPLMVHLGPAPSAVDDIVTALRRDDIVTHCFSGWPGNTLLDATGAVRSTVSQARERGVLFDVGYGASGFDPATAVALIEQGFWPDTLSSDLHRYNTRIGGLPDVLNVFWALGLPLTEVLTRATHRAGQVLGLDGVGRLQPDISPDDVTVLARQPQPYVVDIGGRALTAPQTLEPVLTVRRGVVVHDARTGPQR